MIFVDEARIFLKAGNGGKGCESFYRDKRTRYPLPDGGDGGRGGDVYFIADSHIHTLLDYRFKQHYQGARGGNASSKNKHGRNGKDCILRVPIGTIVKDYATGLLIKDLTIDQQSVIVARGGRGGIGNNKKRTPRPATPGEERTVNLELKIIADVGLVGFPNAGKSTIISQISRVKSKVANYPFTTKQPILGIVVGDDVNFVVADLPGIIEGAHLGKGLGDRFLRHAERTRLLVEVVDMAGSEGRDPLDDFKQLNYELEHYGEILIAKKKLIVANKMDLPEAQEKLKRFKKKVKQPIISVSALTKEGLDKLVEAIRDILCQENSQDQSRGLSLK
jgi:GTP-binding protein